MDRYKTMNFQAKNKTALLRILRSVDVVGPLISAGIRKEHAEAYAVAHLLSSLAAARDLLIFPLELVHREPPHDRPDFLLTMGEKKIGIEHTEARPENETRKDVLRKTEGIGPSVCFMTPVEPNEPRRCAEELRKEIKANDPKEGWGDQDKTDRRWAEVMLFFIDAKEQKLQAPEFSRYDEDWLLIRDAWPFPLLDRENASRHLFSQIRDRSSKLQFHRVFIVSYEAGGPVCEIAESGYRLHRRKDLWTK